MMIGQLIVNGPGTTPVPMDVYTPWLPAKGTDVVFMANVLHVSLSGGGTVKFSVETKFSTETDSQAGSVGSTTTGSPQLVSFSNTGELRELYRCMIGFDAAGDEDWAIVQMLDPVWEPTVD